MPDNKTLSTELGAKPELQKYKKKVMPFVQAAKEKVAQYGIDAIRQTLDFDEMATIKKNIDYLTYTVDVSSFRILFVCCFRYRCFFFQH